MEPKQYGGCGIITTKEATHRVISTGVDPRGLGRWASVLISGRQQHKVRIVSVYNPCHSTGRKTVYQQQLRYIREQKLSSHEPHSLLQEDLSQAIESWIAQSEDLVICLDANQDVRTGALSQMFATHGLHDIILTKHLSQASPPATHAMNQQAKPIDAIFTTLDLTSDIRCGYMPFGDGLPGDHRLLWVDLPFQIMLGHNPPHLNSINAPRLVVQDPRCRQRYHRYVLNGFSDHQVFAKSRQLRSMVAQKAPVEDIKKVHHEILVTSYSIRRKAAKKCRKKRKGAIPWSPQLQKLFDERKLWTLIIKKLKRVRTSSRKLRRLMVKVGNSDAFQISLEEAQSRRNQAHKAFKEGRKQAPHWRKNHLEQLAQALAQEKGTRVAQELKNLKHREKQRNEARRIRRLRNKKGKGGKVVKVIEVLNQEAPEAEHIRVERTTKSDMEGAAQRENEYRFTKALVTDFYQEPLLSDIGILGNGPRAHEVTAGTYEPPEDLNPYTKLFLKALKKPDHVPPVEASALKMTAQDLSQAWKKQKPNTVSESTCLSYSHHMVGAYHPLIAEVDAALHSAPFECGFSPEPWEVITDAEILKKEGVYDVHKMRTIQLMPADFNMNNKRLGRMTMAHAEKHNVMPKEQDGSRKGHKAVLCFLNKKLTTDIFRQKRQAMAFICNDAQQCYDRMAHAPTLLSMLRLGMLLAPVLAMFTTLQNARHHVSTAFGISETYYGGPLRMIAGLLAIAGVGQGNGAGPASFAALSAVIIQVLKDQG
jgi:hypothetical protein